MAGDSDSKSPKTKPATSRLDATADTKEQQEIVAKTDQPVTDAAKPLAPPPRPGQAKDSDYFGMPNAGGSLNQEPNPFEKSFSGGGEPILGVNGAPETPGGTKLPPVAAITSPSSLLAGTGTTPFNWPGGSLRTGPLSPAMLSGPQTDYFSDQFRAGFPTPNESSLRTGLTPGGSGTMFPSGVPSPNTAALFNLGGGGATPSTVDFHRTAVRAAAAERDHQGQQPLPVTSQPQDMNGGAGIKTEMKSGPFDNPEDHAANGLFMLAQGRNGVQQQQSQYPVPPQPTAHGHPAPPVQHPNAHLNGNAPHGSVNVRGSSEAGSEQSEESEQARPNTRGKAKRSSGPGSASTNGRRKAEEPPAKGPASKKAKTSISGSVPSIDSDDHGDDDGLDENGGDKPKHKMTEEEKRKNFLERNRVAALKCRQRKKQWLANLQTKVDVYQSENDQLQQQVAALREEVVNLKTLLLAHKDCPVTQQQGLPGPYMPGMDSYNAQMNPYGMAGPMPSHQMIPAQGGQRRFS